jgi:hypothetical protein
MDNDGTAELIKFNPKALNQTDRNRLHGIVSSTICDYMFGRCSKPSDPRFVWHSVVGVWGDEIFQNNRGYTIELNYCSHEHQMKAGEQLLWRM